MKLTINQFVITLLKSHLFDIATIIAVVISTIGILLFAFNKGNEYEQQIQAGKEEIASLKAKVDVINYERQIRNEGFDVDKLNSVLGQLVPDIEDYFSIIVALETLSQKSGFFITSYEVGISSGAKTSNQLALTIVGEGDQTVFLDFLKTYNFGGNRLITINDVSYNNIGHIEARLQATFYSGKNTQGEAVATQKLTEADKNLLKTIEDKVSLNLTSESSLGSSNYETKSNPFSQ